MSAGSSTSLIPRGGVFLADLAAALARTAADAFADALPAPALLEVPPGTFGPHLPRLAFDAPPAAQREAWDERLALLRQRVAPEDVKVYFLAPPAPGGAIVVGSSPLAAVPLSSDDGVAARHAELLDLRRLWRVVDLESPGSFIEGKRVPVGVPLPVIGAQRLRFGDAELMFLTPSQLHEVATPPARPAGVDHALRPPPGGGELRAVARAVAAIERDAFVRAHPAPFLLQVPQAPLDPAPGRGHDARTRALAPSVLQRLVRDRDARGALVHAVRSRRADGAVLVGRGAGSCDLVLPEDSVSARHAVLRARPGQLTVVDLESQNGTWLDGARVPPGVVSPVRAGQTLGFGAYRAIVLAPAALHDLARRLTA